MTKHFQKSDFKQTRERSDRRLRLKSGKAEPVGKKIIISGPCANRPNRTHGQRKGGDFKEHYPRLRYPGTGKRKKKRKEKKKILYGLVVDRSLALPELLDPVVLVLHKR
jgi:hypothetical protein